MNPTQLAPAGSLPVMAARRPAEGLPALRPFRRMLDEVWRGSQDRLSRLALGLGLKADQAADVLQDVYLMTLQRPPAIGEAAELSRWLVRVTANRCHQEHRRRGRWRKLWDSLAATCKFETTPVAASVSGGELKLEVDQALAKLADDDRLLVAMRYFADLNSREIGQIMDLPEATVRGRLRAARRKLAQELADWNDEQ